MTSERLLVCEEKKRSSSPALSCSQRVSENGQGTSHEQTRLPCLMDADFPTKRYVSLRESVWDPALAKACAAEQRVPRQEVGQVAQEVAQGAEEVGPEAAQPALLAAVSALPWDPT